MSSSKHFTDPSEVNDIMDEIENETDNYKRTKFIKDNLTSLINLLKQTKIEKNWIIAGFMFIILLMVSLFAGFYVNKDLVWRPKNLCTLP